MLDSTKKVLKEVAAERIRQDAKWGEQNHPDFQDFSLKPPEYFSRTEVMKRMDNFGLPSADNAKKMCDNAAKAGKLTYGHIALEEFCEAFEEAPDSDELREELVQTAAVLVAWIECIDRRRVGKMEKLELEAQDLQVGDLFEYTYRVESQPTWPLKEVDLFARRVTFKHSRNGQMIGSGIRLAWDRPVTVWRKKTP